MISTKQTTRIQRGKILIALAEAKQPLNMRQLSMATEIERPTMCRRIAELQKDGLVRLERYAACPISGYAPVGFYVKAKMQQIAG